VDRVRRARIDGRGRRREDVPTRCARSVPADRRHRVPAWDDFENWRDPTPDLIDITADIARKKLKIDVLDLVGMDFQKTPAMVGMVIRVYRDPTDPTDTPMLWVVDEAFADESDEDGLIDHLESIPRYEVGDGAPGTRKREQCYSGERSAVVMDASGFYQDGAHTEGRTSDLHLRARRWSLFRPQPPLEDGKPVLDNPAIKERMKLGTRVAQGAQRSAPAVRRETLHEDPPRCANTRTTI
jgi:hypothetical protein